MKIRRTNGSTADNRQALAQRRLQYATVNRKRPARKMNKQENKAMSRRPSAARVALVAAICLILWLVAIPNAAPSLAIDDSPVEQRNAAIANVLRAHPVRYLLGSAEQVLPMQKMAVVRTVNCADTQALPTRDIAEDSFAFLLVKEPDTKAINCSYKQVVDAFGSPSGITTIAGSSEQPIEQLLFYDAGAHTPRLQTDGSRAENQLAGDAQLRSLAELSDTRCAGKRTILQIAAHEDDDLLFMNPDLQNAMSAGDCVRTIYLTAGDAGSSKFYWLSRERGSEAAYALLAGMDDTWDDTTLLLGTRRFATLATPTGSSNHSLLFMHLPDGKPDGQGFASSGFESLSKLTSGQQDSIQSVDGQSVYSKQELVQALQAIMDAYKPDEVRTQLPYNHSAAFSDHSDHMTAGFIATKAFEKYQIKQRTAKLVYYMGYPIREQPQNVLDGELLTKEAAFFTYAQYDGAVCGSVDLCQGRGDYSEYLQRQYRIKR